MRASVIPQLVARSAWTVVFSAMASLPSAHASPAPVPPKTTPGDSASTLRASDRTLMISGGAVGLSGLFLAAGCWGAFGGIHAGNPGPGLSLEGDKSDVTRLLRTTRTMAALGIAGGLMAATGIAVFAVGFHRHHKRVGSRAGRISLAPGLGSLWVLGRF